MKILSESPVLGRIVLMRCRCSVWPIATYVGRIGRCGDCGVRPHPIPEWKEFEDD